MLLENRGAQSLPPFPTHWRMTIGTTSYRDETAWIWGQVSENHSSSTSLSMSKVQQDGMIKAGPGPGPGPGSGSGSGPGPGSAHHLSSHTDYLTLQGLLLNDSASHDS